MGFVLFPLNSCAGTLEDLCLRILSENNFKDILSSIDLFLKAMETSYEPTRVEVLGDIGLWDYNVLRTWTVLYGLMRGGNEPA